MTSLNKIILGLFFLLLIPVVENNSGVAVEDSQANAYLNDVTYLAIDQYRSDFVEHYDQEVGRLIAPDYIACNVNCFNDLRNFAGNIVKESNCNLDCMYILSSIAAPYFALANTYQLEGKRLSFYLNSYEKREGLMLMMGEDTKNLKSFWDTELAREELRAFGEKKSGLYYRDKYWDRFFIEKDPLDTLSEDEKVKFMSFAGYENAERLLGLLKRKDLSSDSFVYRYRRMLETRYELKNERKDSPVVFLTTAFNTDLLYDLVTMLFVGVVLVIFGKGFTSIFVEAKASPASMLKSFAGLLSEKHSKVLLQEISDMRLEYHDALAENRALRANSIVVRYYLGIAFSMVRWVVMRTMELVGFVPKID